MDGQEDATTRLSLYFTFPHHPFHSKPYVPLPLQITLPSFHLSKNLLLYIKIWNFRNKACKQRHIRELSSKKITVVLLFYLVRTVYFGMKFYVVRTGLGVSFSPGADTMSRGLKLYACL
jgi:hypothetical protein